MPTREEKKAATRKKLLAAAAAVVAKQGAMAASLDAIAEKAGLTKGAVYSNFESKEDLLFSLVAELGGPTVDLEEFDETRPLAENLEALGRRAAAELASVSQRAWQLGLEFLHYALRNSRARRRYAAEMARSNEADAAFFSRWYEREDEAPTLAPSEIGVVLDALALGLAQRRAINPNLVPDDLFAKAFRLLAS